MTSLSASPLSQIQPVQVQWLWEPYIPRGKLTLLDGDPGIGKSFLAIDLAARLSRGAPLPNGSAPMRPHVSLLLSAEDNPADTTRARAEAAGADLDRLLTIDVASGPPIFFPSRIPDIEELIRRHAVDLLVIDPLMAFLPPEVAASFDQCVRQALGPLAAVAARTHCAILLIRHLRKVLGGRAVHRGLGSMGIIAAVRSGLFVSRRAEDPTRVVLAVTKTNIAGDLPSLEYRIVENQGRAAIEWLGPAGLSADELARPEAPIRARDQAELWLHRELADGPRPVAELLAAAANAGIPERTLNRAKAELRVSSRKVTRKDRSEWYWYDPTSRWPKDAPFRKPEPGDFGSVEDYLFV